MTTFTPFTGVEALKPSVRGSRAMPSGVIVDKSCRVYITQIPTSRLEREGGNALKEEFENFGPIESYRMFTEKTGRFIGSALCTYRNPADAASAVEQMNGKVVEEDAAPLEVSFSKDHGVILLHQDHRGKTREERSHFYRQDRSAAAQTDRWSHDKFEMLAEGKDMEEVLGFRSRNAAQRGGRGGRGGRGRGGGMSRSDRIDAAFEKYIKERDSEMSANHTTAGNTIEEQQSENLHSVSASTTAAAMTNAADNEMHAPEEVGEGRNGAEGNEGQALSSLESAQL